MKKRRKLWRRRAVPYIIIELRRRIEFLAPVYTFPGEDEMKALALNALAVLQGKRQAKVYD